MKNLNVLLACTALLLGACNIPGFGPYAAEGVDRFIGLKFTNPIDPKRAANGNLYARSPKGVPWLYRTKREGSGTRYYIEHDGERCKYSLYVDQNDIIRSWRDEGGSSHMNRCLVR